MISRNKDCNFALLHSPSRFMLNGERGEDLGSAKSSSIAQSKTILGLCSCLSVQGIINLLRYIFSRSSILSMHLRCRDLCSNPTVSFRFVFVSSLLSLSSAPFGLSSLSSSPNPFSAPLLSSSSYFCSLLSHLRCLLSAPFALLSFLFSTLLPPLSLSLSSSSS